jgi:EAL domain-containing protein (putative c-di-GMP-specific phosphodiesterase class I)
LPPADRDRELAELDRRLDLVLTGDHLTMVYQPIVDLCSQFVVGHEALARFTTEPRQPPDRWFADAARVGRAIEFEIAAIERALPALETASSATFLSLNASPDTILSGAIATVLAASPLHRIVLEVTENAPIADYAAFGAALAPLRAAGLRLAIDDVGAGFASLRHILRLAPDIIKLDRSIIMEVETQRPTRALAAALGGFALETGMTIVAEGIETPSQLTLLEALGASLGQGYLLGRPGPRAVGALVADGVPSA